MFLVHVAAHTLEWFLGWCVGDTRLCKVVFRQGVTAIYQQDLRCYHSRRIKTQTFQEGDLVIRLIQKKDGMHKLSSPWEGPFVVSKNLYNGSYCLVDIWEKEKTRTCMEETLRPWSISQLRLYYTYEGKEYHCTQFKVDFHRTDFRHMNI